VTVDRYSQNSDYLVKPFVKQSLEIFCIGILKLIAILYEPADSDIKGIQLVHLADSPRPLLPVPAHHRALVAVVAQGYRGVLLALVDVVG
jgi:hypothetical protein